MIASKLLAAITMWLVLSATGNGPSASPAIALRDQEDGDLLALHDGSLALIATDGRIQFRSSDGAWAKVVKLPVDSLERRDFAIE